MEKITMFMLKSCPYCKKAISYHKEVLDAHPEYAAVELELVEEREQAARAEAHDYYYVPTYYVGDKKLHEGAASYADVEAVFRAAYGGMA